MRKFRHIEDLIRPAHQPCAAPGCAAHAEHKAPLYRDVTGAFQWFCLAHIQEFNRKWDYFSQMSQAEIERFQWEASMGHRPTWKMNPADARRPDRLREAFGRFMHDDDTMAGEDAFIAEPPVNPQDRKALADLDMQAPCTADTLKAQYKKLVKQYHPDRNPGNSQAEERFKRITAAYHFLIERYSASSVD